MHTAFGRKDLQWSSNLRCLKAGRHCGDLFEDFVHESERLEIKEALGEDLVDETLDLLNEVSG